MRFEICPTWEGDDPREICGQTVVMVVLTECEKGHKAKEVSCAKCAVKTINEEIDCTTCFAGGEEDVTVKLIGAETF